MGQQQSSVPHQPRHHEVDPLSKMGKRASMRTSLLTAEERTSLIRRSLNQKRIDQRRTTNLRRSLSSSGMYDNGTYAKPPDVMRHVPLQGCVRNDTWNKLVRDVWATEQKTVIHTIYLTDNMKTIPRGAQVKITRQRTTFLPLKQPLPDSIVDPCNVFEAICEDELKLINKKIPNRFLVVHPEEPQLYSKPLEFGFHQDISDEPAAAKQIQPEATQPEATQPEATQPEATQPKATQPKATQHETTQHETTQPKKTQHETTQPKKTQHETTQHETTQPKKTQHETTQHEAPQHEVIQPKTQPDVEEPSDSEAITPMDAAEDISLKAVSSVTGSPQSQGSPGTHRETGGRSFEKRKRKRKAGTQRSPSG